MRLRSDLPTGRVGHLQIAGVPDRHEPDAGELAIDHLFAVIDELGFDGWVGCEYRPAAGTSEGLGWLKMRVVITGGFGFIGTMVARELLATRMFRGSELTELVLADRFVPPGRRDRQRPAVHRGRG